MKKYIYMIKQINEAAERCVNRQMRRFDLTYSQVKVLFVLHMKDAENCSLKELEAEIGVAQQTMAGLVKRLEMKGLVETFPDPKERRAKRVRLTDAGREMESIVKENIDAVEEALLQGISQENVEIMAAVMDRFLANLEEMTAGEVKADE